MKVVTYSLYGPPDVLQIQELTQPTPGDRDVLVRVRAASLNPIDWHFMRGEPYPVRLQFGLRKPNRGRLGLDMAGHVEAVGSGVTQFKPGDAVYGGKSGTLAEYVCVSENALLPKPHNLTFEQAAAVPVAALTALQALRDRGRLKSGQSVLINGASGGVGTFTVPIAKLLGAHVTGVCSTRNVDLVRSLGADRVIDYSREDFSAGEQQYDVLVDCVGNHSLSACLRVIRPRGSYVMVGGPGGRWLGPLARGLRIILMSPFVRQHMATFITKANRNDLRLITSWIEAGTLLPVIDCSFPLGEVAAAMEHLETGHARGKVVIRIEDALGAIAA